MVTSFVATAGLEPTSFLQWEVTRARTLMHSATLQETAVFTVDSMPGPPLTADALNGSVSRRLSQSFAEEYCSTCPSTLVPNSFPRAAPSRDSVEATATHHGVEINEGDVVLIRTGWPVGRYEDAQRYAGLTTGVPGPDASAARWLADRRIRATGADTIAYEWLAPGSGHTTLPVHLLLIVDAGIHIIELSTLRHSPRIRCESSSSS